MLISIFILVAVIVVYLLLAPKNSILWCCILYACGFIVILFATVLFSSKFSNYPKISLLDYRLYLQLYSLHIPLSVTRIILNIGVLTMLFANVILVFLVTRTPKRRYFLLLLLPLIIFAVFNSPFVNSVFYILQHTTKNPEFKYIMAQLPKFNVIFIKSLIIIYHLIPLISFFISYINTKFKVKKQYIIVTAVCTAILCLNSFYFIFGKTGTYFFLDFQNFPMTKTYPTIKMIVPTMTMLAVTITFILFVYFKPYKSLTFVTKKQALVDSAISQKNLRMFFHMQKNLFVVLNKFSSLSEEECVHDPKCAYNNLHIINNLTKNSIDNLTHILNLQKQKETIFQKISPNLLIENAIKQIKLPPNISIIRDYDINIMENITVVVDIVQMTECIINIFNNAIEAIEIAQNPKGKIVINMHYEYDFIGIDIIDNGCGIAKEDIKHIFKPMFSTKTNSKNFGLGLSYVQTVIQNNKGHINIESKLNEGTTVQIVLPNHIERKEFSSDKNQSSNLRRFKRILHLL